MANPILEERNDEDRDDAWSDTESSLHPPSQAPPVPNPTPPPYRHVLSPAPEEKLFVPPVPSRDCYRNGISINVDSKQTNSMGSLRPADTSRTNMVNRSAITVSPFLPFDRNSTSAFEKAPSVPHASTPSSHISIRFRSRQINSVGPDSVLSDNRRKGLDTLTQDVLTSAPQIAAPVPTVPAFEGPCICSAPRDASPVTVPFIDQKCAPQEMIIQSPQLVAQAVSPPNQECLPLPQIIPSPVYRHPLRELRSVSPVPSLQDRPFLASPVQPSITNIIEEEAVSTALPILPSRPRDQDISSLPSRKAISRVVPPSHPQANPPEVVKDLPAPIVSCQCPCLRQVQRCGLFEPAVLCQNSAFNSYEVQKSTALAPCARLHAYQENEAMRPLASHINPQEADVIVASSNPLIRQGDILDSVNIERINLVGLSDPVLSDTRRKKLDMLNRLHSLGIQRDVDLPSIVVIGPQNGGKSSFIGSISGVNLPRSGGACTRCPIECRLVRTASSERWQCTVSLRFVTDEHGKPLDVARNITFGNIINDPNHVEDRLRRAQLSILNPSIPPEMLLDDNIQVEHDSNRFSNNVISLEIRSPDVTDLSFYDLPGEAINISPRSCDPNRFLGLIASVPDGGRDEDVEDIRELVISYIRRQNCIILLTVTCEGMFTNIFPIRNGSIERALLSLADFETQGAYRLAKKYDPEGMRTIGKRVLTKPDRIPEGEHSCWIKLLRNEVSPLRHGWFCVKQLSTMELQKGYSFEKSRRFCARFFKTTAPWDTLDAACQKRLGTKAVMVKLNEFLVNVISERIPGLLQELLRLIRDTKDRIQALPAPPSSNPLFEVVHLINQLCDSLYSCSGVYLDGFGNCEGLASLLGNPSEDIKGAQEKFRKSILETVPKFQPYARNAQLKYPHFRLPCGLATEVGTGTSASAEIIYLDDVSAMRTGKGVIEDWITCYTEKWKISALHLINDLFRLVIERQARLLMFYFKNYTSGRLSCAVQNLLYDYMQGRKEILQKQVKSLAKFESTEFTTLNNSAFLQHKSAILKEHEKIRQAYVNVDKDDFALNIITSVEAHFEVTHQRFIDNVFLAIDHKLVRVEKRSLQEILYKGLDLMGSNALEKCAKLIAENTQLSGLQAELGERLERLEAVESELLDSD